MWRMGESRLLTQCRRRRHNFLSGIERKEQQKQKERKDLETKLQAEKESRQKEVKRLTDQRDKLMGIFQISHSLCLSLSPSFMRRVDHEVEKGASAR